ncbi:hypothetical protein DRP07_08790, partial [Archaeoglobales archaeon]
KKVIKFRFLEVMMRKTIKFPTRIEFLDKQIGGVYPGITVLYEMAGAGGREFAVTFLLNNCKELLNELNYVAITKTNEEVDREIRLMFPEANTEKLLEKINIYSLAETYFKDTIVPMKWISKRKLGIESLKEEKNILSELVETIEKCSDGSIILLDSLTDLSRLLRFNILWEDIVDVMSGFKKVCVKRDILLIVLLTAGVLDKSKEEEIFDQVDAVFIFE